MSMNPEVIDRGFDEDSAAVQLVKGGLTLMQIENETLRAIAIQRPRDEEKVLAGALKELEMVPELAEKNYYVIPFKNHVYGCKDRKKCECPSENVQGPSVVAARTLARRWGNCSVSSGRVVSDEDTTITVEAVVMDMETAYRKSEMFSVSKWGYARGGGAYKLSDDKVAKALAIGASKAERNAILRWLPAYLVQKYYARAREIATVGVGKGAQFDAAKKIPDALKRFAKLGVTEEMIAARLGHALSEITKDEFADLVGIHNAIRDGETTVPEAFGGAEPEAQGPTAAEQAKAAVASATAKTVPPKESGADLLTSDTPTAENAPRVTTIAEIAEAASVLGTKRYGEVLKSEDAAFNKLGEYDDAKLERIRRALSAAASA